MVVRRVHFDTWAFMVVLLGGKYADILEGIMRRSGAITYSLVACQAAPGDADAVILRRGKDAARMPLSLLALLADRWIDPGRCMPPLDATVMAIVNELMDAVPELDMTDRLMLAHALADPGSVILITGDHTLLENEAIRLYEELLRAQGRRNSKLEIMSPLEASHIL